jgi:AsmA protein
MKGILKVVAIVAGALVLILVAVLVAVGFLFNPNDYKGQITAAVAKSTGRTLTLDGNLALSTFPTVRIEVGSASLSNAAGFGPAPMAKIGGAELRVSLWPLLFGKVEIGTARLSGLELNLARDARGRNNWQDLGGGTGAQAGGAPSSGGGATSLDLGVGSLEIDDARVTWSDASTGSNWQLTGFGLNAKGFGVGKKFPLDMRFALAGADVAVKVNASTEATITLASDEYKLDKLVTKISGSGKGWPGGQGDATLKIDSLAANLANESLDLNGLSLTVLGITTTGSLKGTKLMSNLSLTGAVDIQQFDPQAVLGALQVEVKTADSKVLHSASAKANFLYNSKQTGLNDMQLKLDDSTLAGRVALEGEKLTYALAVDDINVDRYLPPGPPSGKADAPRNEGSLDAVDLPLDVLRSLDADGTLKFGKAKFSGLTLTDAAFALTAANGTLKLTPTASLYGGKYGGDINVTVEKTDAKMTIAQHVDAVDLDPLGKDLLGAQYFTGIGNVKLDLVASGSNLGQMRKGVDGAVAFDLKNGSLEGVDLWYELRRVRAVLDKSEAPPRPPGPRRTTFSALSATGDVKDALLTNKDLKGVLDFMTITGSGTVNLLDDKIDLDLKATMVDGPKLQSDPLMAKYAGQSLPLHATGTMAEPSVTPDVAALAKERATSEVNKAVDEQKQKAQDKLKDKLKGLLNR